MLGADGHIKLVDFGFAKELTASESFRTFTNCGTPSYIAPEVIKGIGHGFMADIWSLGVLICDLVNGSTPFQDGNPKVVYDKILACQPHYGPLLDAQQKDLLN
jgi:serine/threonine protein kinase